MSTTDVKELAKFFALVGAAIWGWNQVAKRSATVRNLLTY